MLNTVSIVSRIQSIMDEKGLSASNFASKIGVQRSSVSHILSGRNKPSLEFLIKIEQEFDDISLEWLVKGSHFPSPTPNLSSEETTSPGSDHQKKNDITKIIHYFRDGSFEVYHKR